MYVCLCNAVTERDIQCAVYQGAVRMRDLREKLNIASECGKCACHANQVLRETLLSIAEPDQHGLAA